MSDDTKFLPNSPAVARPEHEPATVPPPGGADEPRPPAPPGPATSELPPVAPAPPAPPSPPQAPGAAGVGQTPLTPPGPPDPPPPSPPAPPQHGAPLGSPVPPTPPGRGRRAAAVVVAAGLLVASATGGAALALHFDNEGGTRTVESSLATSAPASGGNSTASEPLSKAAATVLPSVVSIAFESGNESGSGSGIIISTDGQILTNNHVVAAVAGGGNLQVTFSDGKQADASIVGRDPATDLAVIQAKGVSGLTPATFGSSADLHVGDTVLAIGSPLGLDGSVTSGIVSALDRAISLQGEGAPSQSNAPVAVIDAIQTDAAINPGNSGGALVNADGQVVGINTAIASLAQGTTSQGGNIGVGFAIPIDSARDIADQLVTNGKVTHAFLGVRIADTNSGNGALVGSVEAGQPAAQAGLQQGDVITKVGDQAVTDAADLTAAIRTFKPGDKVTVTYTRDGNEHTADVTLAELPSGN
jgi:putative serine protease PepD